MTRENRGIFDTTDRPKDGYWLIPKEIYDPLNKEFNFDFDPCPNPKPEGYDSLKVEWGKSNWVNPPFWAGITGWVRKAIAEKEKGKRSVLILPLDNWVRLLIENGAEIRSLGSHDWVHTKDGTRRKAPRPSFLFILDTNKQTERQRLKIAVEKILDEFNFEKEIGIFLGGKINKGIKKELKKRLGIK